MRISEKVVRIGLILMVALSIYFSYAIWLSPAGKSSINVDETNTQTVSYTHLTLPTNREV